MRVLQVLRRVIGEILVASPAKAIVCLALLAALSLTEGVGLVLLMPLLALVGVGEATTMPKAAHWVQQAFAAAGLTPTLGAVLLLYVGIAAARGVLARWQAWVGAAVQEDVMAAMRLRLYRAMAGAQWKFLVTRRSSEFVHVLAGEIGRLGVATFRTIELSFVVAVSLVYLGLAVHLSPLMALLVLGSAGGLAWAARGRLGRARVLGGRASAARGQLHTVISEHVGSMKTAKSYGVMGRHIETFLRLTHELRDISLEATANESTLDETIGFGATVLLATIVWVSHEWLAVTGAQLIIVLFVFGRLMPRMMGIYRRLQSLAAAGPVFDAVTELEGACLDAAEPALSTRCVATLEKSVRFEDVSFGYLRRRDTPAVRNVDCEILAGLTTAIVGASGAGKTTLADLLIGLLSPTAGRILVDGQPLDADRLEAWRRHTSYVPQDTFLFHDTVRANLEWACPDAADAELWDAVRLAAADAFVNSLPQGLDTVIGERGVLVSGGERQRLSLARALLRRPRMLVLDEATSSLDSETEMRIQAAIESLHREMTIVIVTHRLSMIAGADVIHVMDAGRIVESGTWEELLARGTGRFVELCRAQGIYRRPARAVSPETRVAGGRTGAPLVAS